VTISVIVRTLEGLVEPTGVVGERWRRGRRREELGKSFSTPRVEVGKEVVEVDERSERA
jgi:hypothetical protein